MKYDVETGWIKSVLCRVPDDQGRGGLGYECHLGKNHGGSFHESILEYRWMT